MGAANELTGYDFALIRGTGGFSHVEPWKVSGALENAMHAIILDLFDGAPSPGSQFEFTLGFLAAIDMMVRGKMPFSRNDTKTSLEAALASAFDDMHGVVKGHRMTDLMTKACESIDARDAEE